MGLEVLDAKRVFVVQERYDVLDPSPYVGLSHAQLYLHVEEVAQWEGLYRTRVDAGERERSAASALADMLSRKAVARSSCSLVLCKMEPTSEPPASIPTASMAESTPRPSVRFRITSLTLSTAE